MKLRIFVLISALAGAALFTAGCPGPSPTGPPPTPTNTPAKTHTPTITPTATPTFPAYLTDPNGPLVVGIYQDAWENSVSTVTASLYIEDHLGSAITGASVTLTTPSSGSHSLNYAGTSTFAPPAGLGVTALTGGYYTASLSTYDTSGPCTFTVANAGATYISQFVPVNPACSSSAGPSSGVTMNWTNGGNKELVVVTGADNLQYGPPITSPYAMAPGLFVNDPGGSLNDTVALQTYQVNGPGFTFCQSSSVVMSTYWFEINY